ncbi:hypothetical protein B1748_10625 [Paenibacillus sp. MY03]|uniref:GGDEF domain-containing protein n=1 Tax=Paenibacillus sp. MY03 TaxID=302980 RepID=UPI000B3C6CF9|nr:GGDEF domain-containing protein [Paenibacillus sp. MY03]OUS76549.1 hypothetical protein B1748_10625 [Paenibacillus sp. MY03]
MSKVGTGLLHEALVSVVMDRWKTGGVVALYVEFMPAQHETALAIEKWAASEPGVFWKQSLESGILYWLEISAAGISTEAIVQRVTEELQRLSGGTLSSSGFSDGGARRFGVGAAWTRPMTTPEMAEAHLLSRIQEAVERGERHLTLGTSEPAIAAKGNRGEIGSGYPIGKLASPVPLFECNAKVSEVANLFDANPNVQGVIIVKDSRPAGVIMRDRLYQQLAGQFGHALYASRSVELVMDRDPLIVEEYTPVERVSQLAMSRDESRLYDIVVMVKDGIVMGAATIRGILECMTALRTEEARIANPLTGLPGNSGIEAELSRRIANREPFSVVYADLDYFKWFNDCFGFARGDELIRYLAELMVGEFANSDSRQFFVGHIGGDDFIGVVDPPYAERVCERLIEAFDGGVHRYYGGVDISVVENRQGQKVEQNGVTLSLSLLQCDGTGEMNLEDISVSAARLKKRAKSIKGSVYVAGEWKNSQPREK